MLKRIIARLKEPLRTELHRLLLIRQARGGKLGAYQDPEFGHLEQVLAPGDWVIDVGANVGDYTSRMSALVGRDGRVIAIEPIPRTADLLTSMARHFAHPNVTVLNVAASDRTGIVYMQFPLRQGTGVPDYYEARITGDDSGIPVLTLALDQLAIPKRISLVKIDAEGHDDAALRGMFQLVARDLPHLIVESLSAGMADDLLALGYRVKPMGRSPNVWYAHENAIGEKHGCFVS